ncbi:translocation/assembly module TamB domain-containing protein [Maritalea mobilis]|uniref:translocation/assembly module TamB domain-containing protein n=1 Tax=Maritalea mobilis TaxID=483324 RepID=UPI001C95FE7E|nr:translocation/assembly module TamB domain-containing protein [Maritalea mobilis]MBY6201531.1 translocation/assembly module TamB domain-containing protein [Maritalea mobilis]
MLKRVLILLALALLPAQAVAQDDADDDRGRIVRFLEEQLSDGARQIRIDGFRGALSSTAELDRLSIADAQGEWLILENARLVWTRTALFSRELQVDELTAERLTILRTPETGEEDAIDLPPAEAQPFALPELPIRIAIDQMAIDEIDLDPSIIGVGGRFSISGSARLADGDGQADIELVRLDGPGDTFDLTASYANETELLSVDLLLTEEAGGLASELLNLPGRPSLRFEVSGEGPIDDFTAEITLDTDGARRVEGMVTSMGQESGDHVIAVDLGGDLTPMMPVEYHAFFGEDTSLAALVRLHADGAISLENMDLASRSLELVGSVELDPARRPLIINLTGTLADPAGSGPVRLPVGAEARLRRATLALNFDASDSDAFVLDADVSAFEMDDLDIRRITLSSNGTITPSASGIGAVAATVTANVEGLEHRDPGLAQAMGDAIAFRSQVSWTQGAAILISGLSLSAGDDLVAGGGATIQPGEGRIDTALDLAFRAADLARFSAVSGQDLTGGIEASLTGRVEPLSGAFDIVLDGTGNSLGFGAGLPPELFAGDTVLSVHAIRDTAGLRLEQLALDNGEITASGSGALDSSGGRFETDLRLRNVGLFTDALSGPVSADANLTRRGTAPWQINVAAEGPGGIRAGVTGGVGLPDGSVDLQAQGSLPLALANRFIRPRSINGTLNFDLALRGQPGLSALSGTLTASGARASLPTLQAAVEDLNLSANLSGGRVTLNGGGRLNTGGQISTQGSINLVGAGMPADISITVDQARLVDPELYEARISRADLNISGGLTGYLQVAGRVDLGETELRVPETGLGGAAPIPPIRHVNETAAERQTRRNAGLLRTADAGSAGAGVGLDLTISAPGRVYLRGRGIDAEFGGEIRLNGTSAQVIPSGQFNLIRGRLSILGTRLDFTEGSATLQGSFDPYLDLAAESRAGGYTITISVDGPASSPEITFGSDPSLPEDEVLARLLFGRSVSSLSPVQLLQLADAASSLAGGSTNNGFLANLRSGLGLDDLDLQTDEEGNAAVRAGRYLSDNIYTDVTVNADGEADLSLNIDLTPDITARGSFSSDGSSSVGVFYERDY